MIPGALFQVTLADGRIAYVQQMTFGKGRISVGNEYWIDQNW